MRQAVVMFGLLFVFSLGCGKESSTDATAGDSVPQPAPQVPAGKPEDLPKVPLDEDKIRQMLRDRYGEIVARSIKFEIESDSGRVRMTGEVPTDELRQAIMKEVSVRVDGLKIEDFNLDISGPIALLTSFEARVGQLDLLVFSPDLSITVTKAGEVYETTTGRRINRLDLVTVLKTQD